MIPNAVVFIASMAFLQMAAAGDSKEAAAARQGPPNSVALLRDLIQRQSPEKSAAQVEATVLEAARQGGPCTGFCPGCGFCPGYCITDVCYPFPAGVTMEWTSQATTKPTTAMITTQKPTAAKPAGTVTTLAPYTGTTPTGWTTLGPCAKPKVFEDPAYPPFISMECLIYPNEFKSAMDACLANDAFMDTNNRYYFPYCCRKWLARGCFGDIPFSMHW